MQAGREPADDLLAARLRALGHPARLALLRACMEGKRSAGDLVEMVDLSPAAVSEHLKVLRKTRLLVLEVRHRYRLYRADPQVVDEIVAALEELTDAADGRRATTPREERRGAPDQGSA